MIDYSIRHERMAKYMPTPKQIAAECAEIQSGWSEDEKRKRHIAARREELEWSIPVCKEGEP